MTSAEFKSLIQWMLDTNVYPSDKAMLRIIGVVMNGRRLIQRNEVLAANGYVYHPEIDHGAKWVKA